MNAAELILNGDGSVYHLSLLPEDISQTIILVGDQDRVPMVTQYFDRIDLIKQRREFVTHTGWKGRHRITVLSTGIGTDNIDIVINELDALVNIDLVNRKIKEDLTPLRLIRIGTSGSVHPDLDIDDILISQYAIGTDALGMYYEVNKVNHPLLPSWAYITHRYPFELSGFPIPYKLGITLTCPGFYGPQRRSLRTNTCYTVPLDGLHKFIHTDVAITNLEMETAGIYLLAEQLGHQAISFNAILAKRMTGQFSQQPSLSVDRLIQAVLSWITSTFPVT
jgi:uridine phosphorylase